MHLYGGASSDFISDATQNRVASVMERTFFDHYRFKPGQSEVRSWQQSLRAMATALQTGDFVDHGILLEWQLPLSSKRLDCMVTAEQPASQQHSVVAIEAAELLELVQWRADDELADYLGTDEGRAALEDELADVLIYLLRLSDVTGCRPPAGNGGEDRQKPHPIPAADDLLTSPRLTKSGRLQT